MIIKTDNFKNEIYDILKVYDQIEMALMIAGGSILDLLDEPKYQALDTSKWRIYYADERCNINHLNFIGSLGFLKHLKAKVFPIVPVNNDDDRPIQNCESVFNPRESSLQDYRDYVLLPKTKALVIENNPRGYDLNNNNDLAKRYEEILVEADHMDVCLLDIGANGHICSIWPDSDTLYSDKLVEFAKVNCPLSESRITVTTRYINNNVKDLFFVIPQVEKSNEVTGPHPSILNKILVKYTTIIPK